MDSEEILEVSSALYGSLATLLAIMQLDNEMREYVRMEHVDFLETRFRTFDEYLASINPEAFLEYTRLYPSEFEELYRSIEPLIVHPPNHLAPICARRRLCLYLRYVAHGMSFRAMSAEFSCGVATVSVIVNEVTDAIIEVVALFGRAFPQPTQMDFEETARKTQVRYDYPRACGFLDGKHIAIVKPPHAGSAYYNYKQFHSIVLLALCDCDYNIIAFDIGAPGRAGDAGILRDSPIKHAESLRHPKLQVIHNLLSRRTDATELLSRYPEYNGELVGLAPEHSGGGTNAAKEARNRMALHYSNLYRS
ncbi:hypothetical protein OESDEN_15818 [Oesophagostomum dentatum]|uniref:DDE Tnp4 domain-containing protein n=1 Tax=Oesophagostomum dentatum TaxID=61180 RepID=A0A0B1SGK1_OESDE|nr:hypothetical protein OESDEN_15818 [Oesophagostomum dentatum]